MRRWTIVAFAVLASLLVVTASPASAAGYAVGSKHTDFGTMTEASPTLSNMTVEGSGDRASVVLNDAEIIESAEDNDVTEYDGANGLSTTTKYETDGSFALNYSRNSQTGIVSSTDFTVEAGKTFYADYRSFDDADTGVIWGTQQADASPSGYLTALSPYNNEITLYRLDGSTFNALNSTSVDINTNKSYTIKFDWGSSGHLSYSILDNNSVLATVTVSDSTYQSGGIGLKAFDGSIYADNIRSGRISETGRYSSANHSVSNAQQAWLNLTLDNTTATGKLLGYNSTADEFQVVNSAQYSSTGNHTLDISGTGYETWRVRVEFNKTGSNPVARLHDEGILVDTRAPTVNNASATPANGNGTSGRDVTFEINVSDSDFGSAGDSVDATLVLDGTDAGTTTLTSSRTASVTVSNVSGGSHSYHWRLVDDYGYETTSATFEFQSPLILYVHDGNNQSSLVTSTTVTAEFIETGGDYRETRSVSDGSLVVGGVPDSQLKIQLTAEGYADRRILIDHPYARFDRHTILLNESKDETFEQCFGISSQGAGFEPADTWLVVERYIDGEWRDASGSYFGSTNSACVGVTDGEEYRLNVREGTKSKDLGGYTADIGFRNQVLTLEVRSVDVGISSGKPYTMAAKGRYNETTGKGAINITFAAHDQPVSDLRLRVYERGNKSNTVFEKTVYGDVETYAGSVPIAANATDETYVFEWSATEGEDKTISGQQYVNVHRSDVDIGLSPMWRKVGFGSLILFVGGLFGPISAPIGAVVTAGLSGALWYSGVLNLSVGVIIYAGSVSLAFYASSQLGGR